MDLENSRPNKGVCSGDELKSYKSYIIPTTKEATEASVRHKNIEAVFDECLSMAIGQGFADIEAGRVSDDLKGLFARVESKFDESS